MIRTPEYLQKGGRTGGAAALLGCLLPMKPIMKPILSLSDGQGTVAERQRPTRRPATIHLMSCSCT
ncbi:MAG: hypothetical protein GXP37_10765 [Chloroflexi bacterium]|nr:hypothetical protein [Chloroflexota bacterium]